MAIFVDASEVLHVLQKYTYAQAKYSPLFLGNKCISVIHRIPRHTNSIRIKGGNAYQFLF